jgi:hypothetical protein
MLKHIWTVLCQKSVIDQESNNISLYDVVEKVSVEAEVAKEMKEFSFPLSFEIVSLWAKVGNEKYTGKYRVEAHAPNGNLIGQPIINEVTVPADIRRVRTRLKVNGIVLSESGDYSIEIFYIEGKIEKKVTSVPLEVELKLKKKI